MKRKKLIALVLVLAVSAGALTTVLFYSHKDGAYGGGGNNNGIVKPIPALVSGLFGALGYPGSIQIDGVKYKVSKIDAKPVRTEVQEGEKLPVVGDMETLLKLLKDRGALYDDAIWFNGSGFAKISGALRYETDMQAPASAPSSAPAPDTPARPPAAPGASAESPSPEEGAYSQTNEQVAGVSEGDIVKTDGKYIYAMSPNDNILRIISADGAKLEVVSIIKPDPAIWGCEFYIVGDNRLVIVGSEYTEIKPRFSPDDGATRPEARIMPGYGWYSNNFTTVVIYDITDRSAPKELRRVSMEGWNVSTRVIGGTIYLVTNKNVLYVPYDQADSPIILPFCRDTEKGEEYEAIAFDKIYYLPDTNDASYLLIGALDIYGAESFKPDAYLGAGSTLYMSRDAMYVTKHRWEDSYRTTVDGIIFSGQLTDILRFDIDGTDVVYTGTGTVAGTPLNHYSMDEHNGFLRIATTDLSAGTFVTVLEVSKMSTVGRTGPLAPGEQMQSMRFMGDMGYIVTFRNMDPLFTVDLSNPTSPKMLGELKIPGFSQYLHPVGDGLLLGIGRDTQEIYTRDAKGVETVVGFKDAGLKVSLFDVRNPYDPREVDVLALGEGWAEVCYNPRALMCDPYRGYYGFVTDRGGSISSHGAVLLLCVDNGRLSVAADLNPEAYFYPVYNSRLCFIGDTIYFVYNIGIIAFDYNSFEMIGNLRY